VASPQVARERLSALGARLLRPRHFEDNLLFDDAQSGLRRAGRLLRLRRAGGVATVTWKGPAAHAAGVKSREELELQVSDADAFQALLAGLGLLPAFRYQKYRETWAHEGAELVVDETPIGTFLEIEAPAERIHALAQALGFSRDEYVLDSYVGLFVAGGRSGDMLFEPAP
jgi:adenylate cyclase class 2